LPQDELQELVGFALLSVRQWKMRSATLSLIALVLCVTALAQEPSLDTLIPSPDEQWAYRCRDGSSSIVKTATNELALGLSTELSVPHGEDAKVIWAPNSKRFAFNYSPPHAPHSTYITTVFYELRDDKWMQSPSPVDDSSEDSFGRLAKYLPKGVRKPRLWNGDPTRVVLKVRSWTDSDTAILFVRAWESGRPSDSEPAFIFNLKFDAEGKGKIVESKRVPNKDVENEQAESD
jgi:hypothetical protein